MKGNVIEYFMWGYQQHVQCSFQVSAESLFNQIDRELQPNVFLLGVLIEEKKDRHPICLEPDDCGFNVHSFQNITTLAKGLSEVDEDRKIFHSHPIAQENHNKRIANRAYVEAIDKILKREDFYNETERFVSSPTYVDGYMVFVVLELKKEILDKYYSLAKSKSNRFDISRSFIESTIEVYLSACSISLKDPERAIDTIGRPAEELIRKAGKQFMYTISQAGHAFEGLHGLYDACNNIASLKYEGEEGIGQMIIARKDHPNVKLTLQLKKPIAVRDFRKVRKFLELSNNESLIISDSSLIYGLGKLVGEYNPKDESLFVVNFTSHHKWEVSHNNQKMMVVEYRQPNLPKEKISKNYFNLMTKRLFIGIEKELIDNLWELIIEATKQSHGTMIIISDKAEDESIRLENPSFSLKPFKLESSLVNQITSIDGAVLLDRDCLCHSIGVIIDGVASKNGDSSRGARYNSAIRYYEHIGEEIPTIIIVISEDGMIDVIPNLRSQIKHSQIIEAISSFREMSQEKELKIKSFNKAMDFFRSLEFYLTKDECDEINELREIIEAKNNDRSVRIVHQDLKPNDEMNDSYYLKEESKT